MSIVRMKHLRLIALAEDREELLLDLSKLGCVEISQPTDDDWDTGLSRGISDTNRLHNELNELSGAMDVLAKNTKTKNSLFAPKVKTSESVFWSDELITAAISDANMLNELSRKLNTSFSDEGRLKNKRESLMPWEPLDIPLDTVSEGFHYATFGVAPSGVRPFEEIESAVKEAVSDCEVFLASSDREQHYFFLICHKNYQESALDTLKAFGFSRTQFKDIAGTAHENIKKIDEQISKLHKEREKLKQKIVSYKDSLPRLQQATDALTTRYMQGLSKERMLETKQTILITGWFPARETESLMKLFHHYGCAYEVRDPLDDEEPPILTYNSKMVAPFGIITNMYSPPSYRELDPNPFMAPFFAAFFGIMLSDAAYGLILILIGSIVLLKYKPDGFMKQAMSLTVICGVSTFVWGMLFGGFFGDAIPAVYTMITGNEFKVNLALWFNPLAEPMKMLMFSFIIGGIHIFTGMALQAYLLIRDGHLLDAIFDVGFWWLLLAGAVFAILGITQIGLVLAVIGALGLLLTQGRHEKHIIKKITTGLTSLYNITGYLGDVLSYSRLLALSLATAVIASVINTMGVLTGPIGFIVIFLFGHTFNIAINLIGTFVHTSRLQYVEFFSKFYQGGGVPFKPLDIQTKYVDIIKEEN